MKERKKEFERKYNIINLWKKREKNTLVKDRKNSEANQIN